jgi:hypothetical protein
MMHDHFAEQRFMCSGATQICRIRLWLPHELTSLCGSTLVNAAVRNFKCQKESLLIFLQLSVQVNSDGPFYKRPFFLFSDHIFSERQRGLVFVSFL